VEGEMHTCTLRNREFEKERSQAGARRGTVKVSKTHTERERGQKYMTS
jgi:hypothetical protein